MSFRPKGVFLDRREKISSANETRFLANARNDEKSTKKPPLLWRGRGERSNSDCGRLLSVVEVQAAMTFFLCIIRKFCVNLRSIIIINSEKMRASIQKFISEKNYPTFDLKAVFFDMDGILFDSMPYHAKAWQQAMNEFGLDFSLYDAYMNEGRTGNSTIDEAFLLKYGKTADEQTKQKIYQRKADLFNSYNVTPTQIPDVYELLKILKIRGLQIFVVTGSAQVSLLDMLDKSFPNIFEQGKTVTAFDCKIGKPDAEPYLIALSKAKVEKWQALVVENAPLGVRSAVSAGLFTIGVNTGIIKEEELEKEGANIILPNMRTLIELIVSSL